MRPGHLIAWLLGLVLAAAASWLIWTVGPTYASTFAPLADLNERFGLSLLPLVVWALLPVIFWRVFLKRSGLVEPPALRGNRRAAIAFLASRGIRGRRGRDKLPIFLVAGPPGSGKSSILEQSGLVRGAPAEIGEMSWWVGPDAIFVEMRLSEADTGEGFALIRSIRPKLPINATLLVLSPADLTLADRAEQRLIAQTIADGLRQLDETVGIGVPVHLFLSRIDLIPGFREFFTHAELQERAEPWGFALPQYTAGNPPSSSARQVAIDKGFQNLLAAMRVRHIELLSRETDPVRCGHVQGFAAQIAAIQRSIQPVLDILSPEQDRLNRGVWLRSVFLTSARQETLSIDALLPDMSRRFAMPRTGMLPPDLGFEDEEESHDHFINGALRRAVLPEAGLVLGKRLRGPSGLTVWGPLAAAILLSAGLGYQLFSIFDREIKLSREAGDIAGAIRPVADPVQPTDFRTLLSELQQLSDIEETLTAEPPPSRYAAGLSQRGEIAAAAEKARRDLRINVLAPQLAALIETGLVDETADVSTLKLRLAVAENAHDPDSALLDRWLEKQAEDRVPDRVHQMVTEGIAAIREAGGLNVDAAYRGAAARLIAYKESLP